MRIFYSSSDGCKGGFTNSEGGEVLLPGLATANEIRTKKDEVNPCEKVYVGPTLRDPLDCESVSFSSVPSTEVIDGGWNEGPNDEFPGGSGVIIIITDPDSSSSSSSSSLSSPASPSSQVSQSSFASGSSSTEQCLPIEWSFSTDGTFNDWQEFNNLHIDFRVETSNNCGGTVGVPQSGTATGVFEVPSGRRLRIKWRMAAVVENEDAGFDYAEVSFDGMQNGLILSKGDAGGCGIGHFEEIFGQATFSPGVHTITVNYDTVDGLFHDTSYGVNFRITDCVLLEDL